MDYVVRWAVYPEDYRRNPALGRFAQADSLVPGAGQPRAWDRYSYVFNNPIKYTDPTGHIPCDIDNNCFTLSKVNAQRNLVPKLSTLTTRITLVGVGRGAVEGGVLILVGAFVFTANPLVGGGLGVGGLLLGAAETADGILEAGKVDTLKDFIMGEISLGAPGFDLWFDPNHQTITICRSDGEKCVQISLIHKENYESIAAQVAALENAEEPLKTNQPENNPPNGDAPNTDIYLPIIKKTGGRKGEQNVA